MIISSIQEIIADIKAGKMVILVDEENRENEGDLVLAADFVTPGSDQFHGDAWAGPDLPDADRGALPQT